MKTVFFLLACLAAVSAPAAGENSTPSSWSIEAVFPRTPEVGSSILPTVLGSMKETHAMLEDGPNVYAIIRVELRVTLTDELAPTLNQALLESMLAARKAVLVHQEKTAIASHEALRYEVEIPEEKLRGDWRMFVVGQDFYVVGYEAPPASYSATKAKVFFHSIRERTHEAESAGAAASNNLPASWAIDAVFPLPPDFQASEATLADSRVQETQASIEQKDAVYAVIRDVFPKPLTGGEAAELLTRSRQRLLGKGKGELKREEKTTLADVAGQRYVVDYTHEFNVADYRIDYRLVVIDGVFYTFSYRAPVSVFSADQARTFFKSVKRRAK